MLKECLEVFQHQLDRKGAAFVADNHIPADGTYLLVGLEQPDKPEIVEIKYDKKAEKFSCEGSSIFSQIRKMDYYSKLVDMNKPVDDKKIIHTNNYLAFSVKKENLLPGGKLDQERIDAYYGILQNPHLKYQKKPKSEELYQKVEADLGMPDAEKLNQCKKWMEEHIHNLEQWNIDLSKKEYVKVFFDAPIAEYQKESRRYHIPNIYNSNDTNQVIGTKVYGLPNNNMGLNSKKPYLAHLTRPVSTPYLLDDQEVLIQNQFFEYLYSFASAGKYNVYIDLDKQEIEACNGMPSQDRRGIFFHMEKGKNEAEIMETEANAAFHVRLPRKFAYVNYLEADLNKRKAEIPAYRNRITKTEDMENLIDEVLFSKFLKNNYFRDAGDIKVKRTGMKESILLGREGIRRWLYYGSEQGVRKILDQVSQIMIKGNIQDGFMGKDQFNLRCSLQMYFKKEGESGMGDRIKDIKAALREKINSKDTGTLDSAEEYYFAVGQLVNYFISLNKSQKKMHSLANPFFNAKNDGMIKTKLAQYFKKYNYSIETSRRRFNNLYGMIAAYEPENKVNQDMILAGYLTSNLVYEKKEEEQD